MAEKNVKVDDLSKAVVEALKEYGVYSDTVVEEAVERVTKETRADIKKRVREQFKGTGAYAKSWSQKKLKTVKGYSRVVYAKEPHYRLTHLLEHGHAKVNGGWVEGSPHIAPAEKIAQEHLVQYIKAGMEGIK